MTKIKRNYWILIVGLVNFIILFMIQQRTLEISNTDLDFYGYTVSQNVSSDQNMENVSNANSIHRAHVESFLSIYLIGILVSFSLIVGLSLKIVGQNKEEKMLFLIWGVAYPAYVIIAILYDEFSAYFVEKANFYIIFYLLFIPYIYLVSKYTFIGEKIDLTNSIKENNDRGLNDNLKNLSQLKDANILNDNEFNEKRKALLEDRYKKDFLLSPEYKKLIELKTAGVITQDEIDKKVLELVNIKIGSSNEKG